MLEYLRLLALYYKEADEAEKGEITLFTLGRLSGLCHAIMFNEHSTVDEREQALLRFSRLKNMYKYLH